MIPEGAWPCAHCGKSKASHGRHYRNERTTINCTDGATSKDYEPAEFGVVLTEAIANGIVQGARYKHFS